MVFLNKKEKKTISIFPIREGDFDAWFKAQESSVQNWAKANHFEGKPLSSLLIPDIINGHLKSVAVGVSKKPGLYSYSHLPKLLPYQKNGYYIEGALPEEEATSAALGWALGTYAFTSYKSVKSDADFSPLVWPQRADKPYVVAAHEAVTLGRDLINTPSNDMGPEELAKAAQSLAKKHGATVKIIVGEGLLQENYPAIYAVGKGSPRLPRLIDLRWGKPKHPKVTLVGKGICFDTGGLDIKPQNAMDLMKKDMGGGAFALGLAHLIMASKLPVRLRVLIPAAENATDGNSYRPRDVLQTRKGLTVEVGDTDAEGRLVLCDALAEACAESPDLLMDFATLTGAARAALGPDLPALFSTSDSYSSSLMQISHEKEDPVWIMPLWEPYTDALNSKVADMNNVGGAAGAITAALFLKKFVDDDISWIHLDFSGWNFVSRPGRPEGGEVRGLRACFDLIKTKFCRKVL